jgi:N-acetylneuraminic acid mutarotase
MKRINIGLFSLMLLGVLFSCSKASLDYTQNGNWVSRAIFKGVPMAYGTSFVIGGNAYVGTGYNPNTPNTRLATMYQYTPSPINKNVTTGYDSAYGAWSQIADFGGPGRSNAAGFSANSLGFVGSGTADGFTPLSDFWQYNPGSNQWTQIANLGTAGQSFPRFDATSFSLDSVGYVLTGQDGNYFFGDVWKYSPASGTWSQQTDMPGSKRAAAVTWNYNHCGYLLTGETPGSQYVAGGNVCYDFWKFDPSIQAPASPWIRLRDIFNTNAASTYDDGYTNIVRSHAVAFVITGTNSGDKGYITTGSNGALYNFTWEYDFATDLWTEKTPYEGSARQGAVGFTVDNRGFVTCGLGAGANDDLREFFPNQIYNQYD